MSTRGGQVVKIGLNLVYVVFGWPLTSYYQNNLKCILSQLSCLFIYSPIIILTEPCCNKIYSFFQVSAHYCKSTLWRVKYTKFSIDYGYIYSGFVRNIKNILTQQKSLGSVCVEFTWDNFTQKAHKRLKNSRIALAQNWVSEFQLSNTRSFKLLS